MLQCTLHLDDDSCLVQVLGMSRPLQAYPQDCGCLHEFQVIPMSFGCDILHGLNADAAKC